MRLHGSAWMDCSLAVIDIASAVAVLGSLLVIWYVLGYFRS